MSMIDYTARNGHKLRESVFTAVSAAGGVASLDAATSYSATAACVNIFNSASTSSDRQWIVPVSIKLVANAANTSATNMTFTGVTDVVNRHTGATGTTLTAVSTSVAATTSYTDRTPKAVVDIGALTLIAASDANIVFDEMAVSTVLAVNDTIEIWFGEGPSGYKDTTHNVIVVPPVWIGPGGNFSLHEVAASQAADPKWEYQICWLETHHARFGG